MRIKFISTSLIVLATITTTSYAANSDGMIKMKSSNSVPETINKLENALNEKDMTIFKRIDHADGARKAGMELRPTELLIFGNPKVGTPLMICTQSAALDLPQKVLAYEDENGQVWLAYNDPAYIAQRHNMNDCEKALQKVSNALANFSRIATR